MGTLLAFTGSRGVIAPTGILDDHPRHEHLPPLVLRFGALADAGARNVAAGPDEGRRFR